MPELAPPTTLLPAVLTYRDIQDTFKFSLKHVRNLVAAGVLPQPYRLGARRVFNAAEVRAALERTRSQEVAGAAS